MKGILILFEESSDSLDGFGILVAIVLGLLCILSVGFCYLAFLLFLTNPISVISLCMNEFGRWVLPAIIGYIVIVGVVVNIPRFNGWTTLITDGIIAAIALIIALVASDSGMKWWEFIILLLAWALFVLALTPVTDTIGLIFSVPLLFFGKKDRFGGYLSGVTISLGIGMIFIQILKWFAWLGLRLDSGGPVNSREVALAALDELMDFVRIDLGNTGLMSFLFNLPWFLLLTGGIGLVVLGIIKMEKWSAA